MRKTGLIATLILGLSGCVASGSVGDLSELSHIHNVALQGDTVYVGTHEGLFTAGSDGDWVRVGEEFDVMALTTVDGTLLASGHPGRGLDLPDPIGLVSSPDGGESWDSLSLAGEVDFHLLEASGTTIVGVAANYGVLVMSPDFGQTWETLEVPALTDLAIDPSNSSSIVLATDRGLHRSVDGGENFALTRTTVKPVLLDWSGAGLFGATEDALWRWDEMTSTWDLVQEGFGSIQAFSTSGSSFAVLDGTDLTITDF